MTIEAELIRSIPKGEQSVFPLNSYATDRGLSKREHFAVLLLAGMNANPAHAEVGAYTLCDWAIDQAEKLIAKLERADREDS